MEGNKLIESLLHFLLQGGNLHIISCMASCCRCRCRSRSLSSRKYLLKIRDALMKNVMMYEIGTVYLRCKDHIYICTLFFFFSLNPQKKNILYSFISREHVEKKKIAIVRTCFHLLLHVIDEMLNDKC